VARESSSADGAGVEPVGADATQPSVHPARPIVDFFSDGPCLGKIGLTVVTPTRANGRPAVAMRRRDPDGSLTPHGVMLLEVVDGAIAGLDAFIEPALVSRFSRA
jgi:hypothetical protein